MAENSEVLDASDDGSQSEGKARQRSTIAFPYTDYNSAYSVAEKIHEYVGHGVCSASSQLAAWMGVSSKSSSFRTNLAAARLFGLIESEGAESYHLTNLGTRVVDPSQNSSAKAEAFLRVPLFKALFEKYKGGVTPPAAALEREIAQLGVSDKQKQRARQVFESSAQQTGFRDQGNNRLVQPAVKSEAPPPPLDPSVLPGLSGGGGNGGDGIAGLDLDPLLIALLQKIPSKGEPWPSEKRVRWLRTFAMNVSQVYDDDDSPVDIQITTASRTAPT